MLPPIDGDEQPTWVGLPLRVHRRCDAPMFDIANKMSYGGTMIDGTSLGQHLASDAGWRRLAPSHWIDVRSVIDTADGNWFPAEGAALDELTVSLRAPIRQGVSVFVISPFASVAEHLKRRRSARGVTKIGTVHRTQGEEADVVVLVLGGASKGARRWVDRPPNLLNVAVTRAKHRCYVIGDRQQWMEFPNAALLARALDAHSMDPPIGR